MERFGWRFQTQDKLIQTENDYDKDVFDGDVGIVEPGDLVTVVIPLATQHYMLLQRNLIYTGITRGKATSRADGAEEGTSHRRP